MEFSLRDAPKAARSAPCASSIAATWFDLLGQKLNISGHSANLADVSATFFLTAPQRLTVFDILALDGDDLRSLPLSMRKTNLARLLKRWPGGMLVAPFEQGEIEPDLFRAACNMGLEGMVSKRRSPVLRRTVERLNQGQKPEPPGRGALRMTVSIEIAAEHVDMLGRFHWLVSRATYNRREIAEIKQPLGDVTRDSSLRTG